MIRPIPLAAFALFVAATLAAQAAQAGVRAVTVQEMAQQILSNRGKPRVVLFYRSSCSRCRAFMPEFVPLARQHEARGVVVLAFAFDDDSEVLGKYLAQYDPPFAPVRLLPYRGGELGASLAKAGILIGNELPFPFVVVFDRDNRVVGQGHTSIAQVGEWLTQAQGTGGRTVAIASDPTPTLTQKADGKTYAGPSTCTGSGATLSVQVEPAEDCLGFIGQPGSAVFTALGPLPIVEAMVPTGICQLIIDCASGRRAQRRLRLAPEEKTAVVLGSGDWH